MSLRGEAEAALFRHRFDEAISWISGNNEIASSASPPKCPVPTPPRNDNVNVRDFFAEKHGKESSQ
jgi:hypothetical protein